MKHLILTVALVTSLNTFAASVDIATVEGRIDRFDHDKITPLVSGKPVVVPRDSTPKYYSISYNNVVTAYLPSSTIKLSRGKRR